MELHILVNYTQDCRSGDGHQGQIRQSGVMDAWSQSGWICRCGRSDGWSKVGVEGMGGVGVGVGFL